MTKLADHRKLMFIRDLLLGKMKGKFHINDIKLFIKEGHHTQDNEC